MRDLETIGLQVVEELNAIGLVSPKPIKWVVGRKTTRNWGLCTTCVSWDYTKIKINGILLEDDADENTLRNCIAHEYLHAVDENKSGHKGRWLEYAELVSDCYPYMGKIERLVTKEEREKMANCEAYQTAQKKRADAKDRWQFTCAKCGHVYRRARRPKYLTDWGYCPLDNSLLGATCGVTGCHGKLIITKAPKSGLNDVKRVY